jgi:putative endonuclease
MASARNGTLYIGVTQDLPKRVWEHREGVIDGFTKRYGCKMLVWFEAYDDLQEARQREVRLKKWNRIWKLRLIEDMNPDWCDLYETLT